MQAINIDMKVATLVPEPLHTEIIVHAPLRDGGQPLFHLLPRRSQLAQAQRETVALMVAATQLANVARLGDQFEPLAVVQCQLRDSWSGGRGCGHAEPLGGDSASVLQSGITA